MRVQYMGCQLEVFGMIVSSDTRMYQDMGSRYFMTAKYMYLKSGTESKPARNLTYEACTSERSDGDRHVSFLRM
jgi:hypothetical protein